MFTFQAKVNKAVAKRGSIIALDLAPYIGKTVKVTISEVTTDIPKQDAEITEKVKVSLKADPVGEKLVRDGILTSEDVAKINALPLPNEKVN